MLEKPTQTPEPLSPLTPRQVPPQRWQIFPAQKAQAKPIAEATALSPLLAQVLINRGIYTPEQAWEFLDPETPTLPSPLDEFPDLAQSLELLVDAIHNRQKILICGDYDADGMTSTALLMRSLRYLGAQVDYAIPSRMDEGYGINQRIVEDFHAMGGAIILTVDNGIAAYEPVARAQALGLTVILTDHHEVPENIPPANAILNPKLIRESSPYRGVAGVGVAYILAVCLAQRMDKMQDLTATLLALFTLGTIADLAPLTGVNRRWVKRGLKLLPKSQIPGVQALIEVAGLSQETALKPEAIGFRLGPRINAVGRIADPQIVIELLTTDDLGVALQRAMQCEEANKLRRQMCEIIEAQAVEWCEQQQEKGLLDLKKERVLVVVQPEWHHGVIGIVASRLVERYGVPVFIGTYEDKSQKEIRGSARSIPEFNVFDALQFCDDLLDRYGGHRAAGGFSFEANKLRQVKSRLSTFACKHLQPEHLKPLVTVDVQAQLADIDLALYGQIDQIHPCGIENPDPVFWTANVTVVEQKVMGKNSDHLKLTLAHPSEAQSSAGGHLSHLYKDGELDRKSDSRSNRRSSNDADHGSDAHHGSTVGARAVTKTVMKAIAWRWGTYYPLPRALDIAYKLRLNEWQDRRTVELELVGVRPATITTLEHRGIQPWSESEAAAVRAAEQAAERAVQPDTPAPDEAMPARPLKSDAKGVAIAPPESSISFKLDSAPAHIQAQRDSSEIYPPQIYPLAALTPENTKHRAAESSPSTRLADVVSSVHVEFYYAKRRYKATLEREETDRQLTIENGEGHLLVVQLSARKGFLYVPDKPPEPVDITDLKYFNLIRAGLNALEVKQKTQLLIKKDELLAEKDSQIANMKAQIELLEEKITQLSAEQQQQFADLKSELQSQEDAIQGQEAHIEQLRGQVSSAPVPNPAEIQKQVRDAIGDSVWFCLQTASQKDFQTAYKTYQMLDSSGPDAHICDYSEAGLRLGLVIAREILTPFFTDLSDFGRAQGLTEIGGVSLAAGYHYTLDMMPALLAEQWRSFPPGQLSQQSLRKGATQKMVKVTAQGLVSAAQRALVSEFLAQWEHPMATCLHARGGQAASSLDQISKLHNIAAHGESFLYHWQYDLLHQLIAGKSGKGGLLRQIFA